MSVEEYPAPLLSIRDLRVQFKTPNGLVTALEVPELDLGRGESLGWVGESGAGKTILALAILGLLPRAAVVDGSVSLGGEELLGLPAGRLRAIRGSRVAMIFQDPMSSLNPVFTVRSQMRKIAGRAKSLSARAADDASCELIRKVGLPDAERILAKYPHELSGGQRQRVIIAMALLCGAEFLIADEPTRNLDVTVQAGVLNLLADLRDELSMTLLFIANNLALVSTMCDRIAIVKDREVIETGGTLAVLSHPLHPYTRLLVEAAVQESAPAEAAPTREVVCSDEETATGCRLFATCSERTDACLEKPGCRVPVVGAQHVSSCMATARGSAE